MHPILNHLIAQNPDTRTALARHSGRRIALSATGLRLAGVITDEGAYILDDVATAEGETITATAAVPLMVTATETVVITDDAAAEDAQA